MEVLTLSNPILESDNSLVEFSDQVDVRALQVCQFFRGYPGHKLSNVGLSSYQSINIDNEPYTVQYFFYTFFCRACGYLYNDTLVYPVLNTWHLRCECTG